MELLLGINRDLGEIYTWSGPWRYNTWIIHDGAGTYDGYAGKVCIAQTSDIDRAEVSELTNDEIIRFKETAEISDAYCVECGIIHNITNEYEHQDYEIEDGEVYCVDCFKEAQQC